MARRPPRRYAWGMSANTPPTQPTDPTDTVATALDLRPEVAVVRQIIRRLVELWDKQGDDLSTEEGRKLAALIFNGARTAAVLLYHHRRLPDQPSDEQAWLAAALAELGETYQVEL